MFNDITTFADVQYQKQDNYRVSPFRFKYQLPSFSASRSVLSS